MAQAPELQSDPTLAELVRRLAAAYQPDRVYLFGSRARGEPDPDSDYDLLLVVPDDAPQSASSPTSPTKCCGGPAWPPMSSYAPESGSTDGAT